MADHVTTLWSKDLDPQSVYYIRARITAADAAGGLGAFIREFMVSRKDRASDAAFQGYAQSTIPDRSTNPYWYVDVVVKGHTVMIRGISPNMVAWSGNVEVLPSVA